MNLHTEIINIQIENLWETLKKCNINPADPDIRFMVELAYKIGHRDARHKAAELVTETTGE